MYCYRLAYSISVCITLLQQLSFSLLVQLGYCPQESYSKTCKTDTFNHHRIVCIHRNAQQQSSNIKPPTVENDYVMPPRKTRHVEDPSTTTSSV